MLQGQSTLSAGRLVDLSRSSCFELATQNCWPADEASGAASRRHGAAVAAPLVDDLEGRASCSSESVVDLTLDWFCLGYS